VEVKTYTTDLEWFQVSNWFINARVRIWKPMIEEMYKDLKRTSIGWRAGDGSGAAAEYEQGNMLAAWRWPVNCTTAVIGQFIWGLVTFFWYVHYIYNQQWLRSPVSISR
jgi:hypothetical protein